MKTIYNYIIIIILAVISIGCTTTKYIPVETVRIDSVRYHTFKVDSVVITDSIIEKEYIKGDTVFKEKESYRSRNTHKAKVDTIRETKVEYIENPIEVEKELTTWQKIKINTGEIFLCLFALSLVVIAILWIILSHRQNR